MLYSEENLLLHFHKTHKQKYRSSRPEKNTCAYMFSCGFCEISDNAFSYRTAPVAAWVLLKNTMKLFQIILGRLNSKCDKLTNKSEISE